MQEIEWEEFHEIVRHKFKSSKCSLKKEIYLQLKLLSKNDNREWPDLIEAALLNVPVSWKNISPNLKTNLRAGSGSSKIAAAIYYWLHTTEGLKIYATTVDKIAFGDAFSSLYNDKTFPIRGDFSEVGFGHLDALEEIPELNEIEQLRDLIENFDNSDHKQLALALLTVRVHDIVRKKALKYHGKEGLFSFRGSFTQKKPWLTEQEIVVVNQAPENWYTKYDNHPNFFENTADAKFVIIRRDGTRVDSNILHEIEMWFDLIWNFLHNEVIEPRDLDIVLRYILVFAADHRSDFLKFYFPDKKAKFDALFKIGIERAHATNLDLRDYQPLDTIYLAYYHLISN